MNSNFVFKNKTNTQQFISRLTSKVRVRLKLVKRLICLGQSSNFLKCKQINQLKFKLIFLIYFLLCNSISSFCSPTSNPVTKSSSSSQTNSIKNAYSVYPGIETLTGSNIAIPCNISHPAGDTLLMILIYFNGPSKSSSKPRQPIALATGPPMFTLDLRSHSNYVHRYFHKLPYFLNSNLGKQRRALYSSQSLSPSLPAQTYSTRSPFNKLSNQSFAYSSSSTPNSTLFQSFSTTPISIENKFLSLSKIENFTQTLSMNQYESMSSLSDSCDNSISQAHLARTKTVRSVNKSEENFDELTLDTQTQFISSKYASRLTFNLTQDKQQFHLWMHNLNEFDSGEYICRVDFKWSRTLISYVNLFVIVPPKEMHIEDEKGNILKQEAGPYLEGDPLVLFCHVNQGKPLPSLLWYLDNELIDDTFIQNNATNQVVNDLVINELKAKHEKGLFTCKASNHPDIQPLVNTLSIKLNLKPKHVNIVSARNPLRIGRKKEIVCESTGSKPPASIRWMLDNVPLADFKNVISRDGLKTTSKLNLNVLINYDQTVLFCVAENVLFKNSSIFDLWQLEVYYRPKLNLTLDSKQDPNLIYLNVTSKQVVSGKSSSLICNILANPSPNEIYWLFNNKILNSDYVTDTNKSTSTLMISRNDKKHSGVYECIAKNTEGIGRSNSLLFTVNYEPTCVNEEIIYANIGDAINISCIVDASPSDCTFEWNIPNYHLLRHVENDLNLFNKTITYHIKEELDFGSIKCQANNSIGKVICENFILPRAKIVPTPKDCHFNHTSNNIYAIVCNVPEFVLDRLKLTNGLNQKLKQLFAKQAVIYRETLQSTRFFLKIFEEDRTNPLFTSTGHFTPVFHLRNHTLHSNATYLFTIYSRNQYGQSPDVILTTQIQRMLQSKINLVHHQMPKINYHQLGENFVPTIISIFFLIVCASLSLKLLVCIIKHFKRSSSGQREAGILRIIKINDKKANSSSQAILSNLTEPSYIKDFELELNEDILNAASGKLCPDVIPLRVDTLDNGAYVNYNKPLIDCFKKSNLVTFSNQNKIELICSDKDLINIAQKNVFETTYAYTKNGSLTLSTTV